MRLLFSEMIVRSWWVWLFGLICFGVYESLTHLQQRSEAQLRAQIWEKEQAIASASEGLLELQRQLASGEDPAAIEMTLMRALGVAPEGSVKVYFYPPCTPSS